MVLWELEEYLNMSWSKETSVDENWNVKNPALGQCAVTSLVVNDYYGGKIMRCMTSTGSHYYNLIDNRIIDLTASQFEDEIPPYETGEERTREYLLSNENTKKRYELLSKNVKDNMELKEELEAFVLKKAKKIWSKYTGKEYL